MFFVLFSLLPLVVAALANAAQADLIAITGDIVDGEPEKLWRDSNRSSLQPAEAEPRKKQIVSSRVSAGA